MLSQCFFPKVMKSWHYSVNAKMVPYFFDRVENIVRKGENAGNQQFLLFPQCCHNASFPRSWKVGIIQWNVKWKDTVLVTYWDIWAVLDEMAGFPTFETHIGGPRGTSHHFIGVTEKRQWNIQVYEPRSVKWELNPLPDDKFYTFPNWKGLQTTISNLTKIEESYPNR